MSEDVYILARREYGRWSTNKTLITRTNFGQSDVQMAMRCLLEIRSRAKLDSGTWSYIPFRARHDASIKLMSVVIPLYALPSTNDGTDSSRTQNCNVL